MAAIDTPNDDPRTAPTVRRTQRTARSFFAPQRPPAPAAVSPDDESGDELDEPRGFNPADFLAAARERFVARKQWALAHDPQRPLPALDADGHVIVPPDVLARRAAESAEEEAARVAGLTPARLGATQLSRWWEWLRAYELHKPTYLRLSLGPRGEMLARAQLAPYRWEDADERHPDGGRVVVSGVSSILIPHIAERPPAPQAYPNERVLNAIEEQLITGWWYPQESNKPTSPRPHGFGW